MTSTAPQQPRPLPQMREDLELRAGPRSLEGEESWLVYDPLQHKYVQIDRATFDVLSLWRTHKSIDALVATARGREIEIDAGEIETLINFLKSHRLLQTDTIKDWGDLARASAGRHGMLGRLVHNYLFFRIPLVAPEPFLRATSPLVAPLYARPAWIAITLVGLAGLYLAARQWDQFSATAGQLLTLEGAALFGITLFFVKIFHELGHAYTALRFGCRVPSLGVAFMMLAPMLYTDVTDAWRLKDRRQRLLIDAAGMIAEIALAALATLVWAFLPPGTAKTIAFMIAASSWIMSIAVNLNPFMRFDGYYILSDLLKVENLQSRSFEFGVWQLRESLFKLDMPPPEAMEPRMRRFLIAYAWAVWIYRLVLFTGIALLVYSYFFKALGVILFLFEIVFFIGKPLAEEVAIWWKLRSRIKRSRRTLATAGTLAAILLVFFIPWSSTVVAPAILEARELAHVYAPRVARVVAIKVQAGEPIDQKSVMIDLESPEITQEKRLVAARLQRVRMRLARRSADEIDREDSLVLEREQAALAVRAGGLAREEAELRIRAPISGRIVELNPELTVGRWFSQKEAIALVSAEGRRSRGYVAESAVGRLKTGATGWFYPDDPRAAGAPVILSRISTGGSATIEILELAGQFGGPVATQPDARQRPVPVTAQYLIAMEVPGDRQTAARTLRGVVHLEASRESIAAGIWRHILKVLVRESGA